MKNVPEMCSKESFEMIICYFSPKWATIKSYSKGAILKFDSGLEKWKIRKWIK